MQQIDRPLSFDFLVQIFLLIWIDNFESYFLKFKDNKADPDHIRILFFRLSATRTVTNSMRVWTIFHSRWLEHVVIDFQESR